MQIKNTGRGKDLKYLSERLTKQYERRLIAIIHRKGREERKAQNHKPLYLEEIIRPGTRMTRIKRINTDGFQHDERRFVILAPFMEDKSK